MEGTLMDVLIHTLGRAKPSLQHTFRALMEDSITPTFVVQMHEAGLYDAFRAPVHVLPSHIYQLAGTRDYIIHDMRGSDHVVFMDDDLDFAVRREDDPTKFRAPGPGDLRRMLHTMQHQLKTYPMVGIGAREGGNRVTAQYLYNTRIMRVLAFRRSYLRQRMLTFTPLVVMEDFHINLQILRSGADTCICNEWVSNQRGGSDAPGGCSLYRTDQVQAEAARMLASRHPGFVKVVEKTTKTAWGGKTRTDVVVSWKKARASYVSSS